MKRFAEANNYLLYFGEKSNKDCGKCSVCIAKASRLANTSNEDATFQIIKNLEREALSSRQLLHRIKCTENELLQSLSELIELKKIKTNRHKHLHYYMTTKRDLRIVFMGTPDFAVATLKALIEHNYKVVGVITAPDKPAGRGQKLRASAVKQFALEHNLNVLQPKNLKAEPFLKELKALNANLQIIVAFRMLPKVVWQMPEYGTFNLHASLLPQYRGAAPIHWAIINGETKTGVTTFFIDEKIDTGAIILSNETHYWK